MSLSQKLAPLITAGSLTLTSLSANADPDVQAFIQTQYYKGAVAGVIVSNKSFCNFSLVSVDGKTKYLTARHCVIPDFHPAPQDDIALLDSLPPGSKIGDMSDARVHSVSPYNAQTLGGRALTIKVKLPNRETNTMQLYTLKGIGVYNSKQKTTEVVINFVDYVNMLSAGGRHCRTNNAYLSGISGGTVLDPEGRVYGTVSSGEGLCGVDEDGAYVNPKRKYTHTITPIRDEHGNIKNIK